MSGGENVRRAIVTRRYPTNRAYVYVAQYVKRNNDGNKSRLPYSLIGPVLPCCVHKSRAEGPTERRRADGRGRAAGDLVGWCSSLEVVQPGDSRQSEIGGPGIYVSSCPALIAPLWSQAQRARPRVTCGGSDSAWLGLVTLPPCHHALPPAPPSSPLRPTACRVPKQPALSLFRSPLHLPPRHLPDTPWQRIPSIAPCSGGASS